MSCVSRGHTYFIQSVYGGPVKIGSSTSRPIARLKQLQTGHPEPLRVLAAIPGVYHERELHARFAEWRLAGEWFVEDAPGLQAVIAAAQSEEAQLVIDRFEAEHGPLVEPSVASVVALLQALAAGAQASGYLPDEARAA